MAQRQDQGEFETMSLARAVTIADLRRIALRRVPEFISQVMDNGNGDGAGPIRNAAAFDRYLFLARTMIDVSAVDQSVEIFGKTYSSPFGISAVGGASNFRRGADEMLAAAARGANIPFMLSGGSSASIETIARIAPGLVWQQLYATADRTIGDHMIGRARDAGIDVLVYTVDTPLRPRIHWLERAGIRFPSHVPLGRWPYVLWKAVQHPAWCAEYLLGGGAPPQESFRPYAPPGARAKDITAVIGQQIPTIRTWDEVERLRRIWPGKLVLKGITTAADATRAFASGVDAVTVSNHGGNKMEQMAASLDCLGPIVDAAPNGATILFDSGIRRGSDMVIAKALGANFCFVGRATLYGAVAGGERGAALAVEILRQEVQRALAHIGCPAISDADRSVLLSDHALGARHRS